MPGATTLSVTYGIDIESVDNLFLRASLEASHAVAAMLVPGKFLADVIPIRAYTCAQMVTYKHMTDPNSAVHSRLVPWDGVQGSCQRSTQQVQHIYRRSF